MALGDASTGLGSREENARMIQKHADGARWLNDSIATDDKGFIFTGGSASSLQTSMPGVFGAN